MKSQVVLPLRNPASVQLGRLVLDLKEPQSDYFEPQSPEVKTLPPLNSKAFDEGDNSEEGRHFFAYLTKILTASFDSDAKADFNIISKRCRTYQMDNSGGWFTQACKEKETQEWLDDKIEKSQHVYLIVGFQTMLDAKVNTSAESERKAKLAAEAPVDQILSHGATTVLDDKTSAANAGAGGNVRDKKKKHISLIGAGEQLYAIQYRRVKFHTRNSKDNKTLRENQWLRFKDVRSGDDDEGTDDVVDPDLEDDLELNTPASPWVQFKDDDGKAETVVYLYDPDFEGIDEEEGEGEGGKSAEEGEIMRIKDLGL